MAGRTPVEPVDDNNPDKPDEWRDVCDDPVPWGDDDA